MGLLDYASLYDRFGGDDSSAYPLDKKAKSHLFRQGLLQLAAAMSKPNGGNFANSLASGLLAANQSGQEGASQYVNDAYRGDIMKRTRAEMEANNAKQQAWAKLYRPDGTIDPQAEAALRAADTQGYLSNMDKLHPQTDYSIQNIDGQLYYVPKQPGMAPPQAQMPQQAAPGTAPPPSVLNAAVEQQESGGNPFAVSPAGARGPMQTMPGTLRDPGFGVAPAKDNSIEEQRRVGQDYLAALTAKYGLEGGLAAYNWGPGNWEQALAASGGDAQSALMRAPKETRDYVPSVKRRLQQLGGMTASIGDQPQAQPMPGGAFPVPGVPRAKPKPPATPPGYRWGMNGNLEPIPGGPADIAIQARAAAMAAAKDAADVKATQAKESQNARQAEAATSAQSLIDSIDTLTAAPGFAHLGTPRGDLELKVPLLRNDTKDADAQLKNVAGQVALATMSRLKALSKQGATGFGALSEKELSLLQNSIATLQSDTISNAQLKASLKVIRDSMAKVSMWQQGPQQAPDKGGDYSGMSDADLLKALGQ